MSSCPKNRFEVVSDLLRSAGFPVSIVNAKAYVDEACKRIGNKSPIVNRTAFQANLVRLMDEQNLSIGQLAKRTGFSRTSFYHYIDGSAAPKYKYLPVIAKALGVTVDELTGAADGTADENVIDVDKVSNE